MRLHIAVLVLLITTAVRAIAADDALCLGCHDEKGAPFHASVHSSLGCTGCHADVKTYPHPEHIAKVNCGSCHADASAELTSSVHANASPQMCTACHGGAHEIVPVKNPKSPVYPLNLPRTCGTCHGNQQFAQQHGLPDVYSEYMDSIHGFALTKDGLLVAATCSSCHGAHDILAPGNPKSKVNRSNIAATCGACHSGVQQQYQSGVHGEAFQAGDTGAPVCTSCHTAHQIANVREASFQMKTTATCGDCHKEKYGTYRDTFHAQVSALGYTETAHCWDCHGEHDIRPGSDPKSPVAQANLVQTCGKCHTGVTASFVSYSPHADSHNGKSYPALHASALFMNLLLGGFLGFSALHTLLWFNRLRVDRAHARRRES